MIPAPLPPDEAHRLATLRALGILDTEPELGFDDITRLASFICDAPISLVSLIDEHRQWFKSRIGLEARETPRDISFCGHAICQPDMFIVPDAGEDERFHDSPLVTTDPNVRFYAGMPLVTETGAAIGTLCVMDQRPRELDPRQRLALTSLSRQVLDQLRLRQTLRHLADEQVRSETLLLNVLPRPIATRLKGGDRMIVDRFEDASVLFVDIVGFTPLSTRMSPGDLIVMLNDVFSAFDALAERYGVEKIKTIGDEYMVVGGLPDRTPDHLERIAAMALDVRDVVARTRVPCGGELQVRSGFAVGPVIAGVIGSKKFHYDLWSNTVNVASRVRGLAAPGGVATTADAYARLAPRFAFGPERVVDVKGLGPTAVRDLLGRR